LNDELFITKKWHSDHVYLSGYRQERNNECCQMAAWILELIG
jgi:hypothetical protein